MDLSATIWNVAKGLDSAGRRASLQELVDSMVRVNEAVSESDASQLVQRIYRRVVERHADDPRLFIEFRVGDLGDGDFHVMAAGASVD